MLSNGKARKQRKVCDLHLGSDLPTVCAWGGKSVCKLDNTRIKKKKQKKTNKPVAQADLLAGSMGKCELSTEQNCQTAQSVVLLSPQ